MTAIPALGRLKQENCHEVPAKLGLTRNSNITEKPPETRCLFLVKTWERAGETAQTVKSLWSKHVQSLKPEMLGVEV